MKLISTNVTETDVLIRFADDQDEEKAKQWVNVRVPISTLKAPAQEGKAESLDRYFGLRSEPEIEYVGDISKLTLAAIRKAAVDRAQEILKGK